MKRLDRDENATLRYGDLVSYTSDYQGRINTPPARVEVKATKYVNGNPYRVFFACYQTYEEADAARQGFIDGYTNIKSYFEFNAVTVTEYTQDATHLYMHNEASFYNLEAWVTIQEYKHR